MDYNGRRIAIIKVNANSGDIQIIATWNGLKTSTIKFNIKN